MFTYIGTGSKTGILWGWVSNDRYRKVLRVKCYCASWEDLKVAFNEDVTALPVNLAASLTGKDVRTFRLAIAQGRVRCVMVLGVEFVFSDEISALVNAESQHVQIDGKPAPVPAWKLTI